MSADRRASKPFVQLAQRHTVVTFVSAGAVLAIVFVVLGGLNIVVAAGVGLAFTLLHLFLWRPGGIARRTQGTTDDGPIDSFRVAVTIAIIAVGTAGIVAAGWLASRGR
jgi:hypothetical protein